MKIKKSIQKLMPYGIELILQGESITETLHLKLAIRKRFNTNREAGEWHLSLKDDIRKALVNVETVCNNTH